MQLLHIAKTVSIDLDVPPADTAWVYLGIFEILLKVCARVFVQKSAA